MCLNGQRIKSSGEFTQQHWKGITPDNVETGRRAEGSTQPPLSIGLQRVVEFWVEVHGSYGMSEHLIGATKRLAASAVPCLFKM